MMAMRVVLTFAVLGIAGCGDNAERLVPLGVSGTFVAGRSGRTRDPTPTWAFTTRGDPAVVECAIDGAMAVACRDSFTPAASLADGDHAFAVRVADAAGD